MFTTGPIGLLLSSLGAAEWKRLLAFVSPAFFRVMPMSELTGAVRKGMRESRDRPSTAMRRGAFPFEVRAPSSGDAALYFYFRQILSGPDCLLDLSDAAFQFNEGTGAWRWMPEPLRFVFSDSFQKNMAKVYCGFYEEDAQAFSEGLSGLGLTGCEDVFRQHFGEGDQTAVVFSIPRFVSSFEEIFRECRKRGLTLGGDFVALGVMLGLVYEHLEKAGGESRRWDVHAAYLKARRKPTVPAGSLLSQGNRHGQARGASSTR